MNTMNVRVPLLCMTAALILTTPARADLLTNNFWVNSTFESGTDLELTTGTPVNWSRGGDDPSICQVITNNSVSSSHSLAIADGGVSFGEWYSDVTLSGNATNGDTLNIQWYEMYAIPEQGGSDEMRLTVLFYNAATNIVGGEIHFVTPFTSSPGWVSTIADSTFTKRNGSLIVPFGAVTMRCALVSGGDAAIAGVMVIDDLSVAVDPVVAAVPQTILAGNFFPNPTFELGVNLDNPATAAPGGGWIRGGNAPVNNVVITNNSVSPRHSLAQVDDNFGYGEWYNYLTLSGVGVVPGDVLDVQFHRIYATTNGAMRFTFRFLQAQGFDLEDGKNDFQAGDEVNGGESPGWTGSISNSPFERVSARLLVPADAVTLRINFASGGSGSVKGLLVIDDVSVRLSKPVITGMTVESGSNTISWLSMPSKLYTVQLATNLGSPTAWSSLITGQPGDLSLTNTYADTVSHAGSSGFYRVKQE